MGAITTQDTRLVRELHIRGLLSFGLGPTPLFLENLNILIGPNGAGKSNLIEAIALMRAAPVDIRSVVRRGGGVTEWLWKGSKGHPAIIDLILGYRKGKLPLRHTLAFSGNGHGFVVDDERVENAHPYEGQPRPYLFYHYAHGHPVINPAGGAQRRLERDSINPDLSILAQRRDPDLYPEITYLADIYEKVRIYREWAFGRHTVFRDPQKADMRNDRLEEDFSNLGLVLNRLRRSPKVKAAILAGLRDLYEGLDDFDVSVEAGTVQVFLTEGEFTVPATRLSDGTLRYLCLLAILCDPDPPPLICIEEPELGLHPDILPKLADLLVEAAERTQLIVTTHSDILVDVMTERPEVVVVCEKHEGQTVLRRLDREALGVWLEKYRLGELWTRGELGGTRW